MTSENEFYIEDNKLIKYTGKNKFVEVPANVTIIGEKAFANRKSIDICERISVQVIEKLQQ